MVAATLLDQAALDLVRGVLAPEHCFEDRHRRVLEAVYAVDDAGEPVDAVSVAGRLRASGRLEQVGGTAFLAELMDSVPAIANVEAHARTVRQLARVRSVIATCQTAVAEGYAVEDPDRFCATTEAALFSVLAESVGASCESVATVIPRCADTISERRTNGVASGVRWGFGALDRKVGELRPYVYVVAARPGMGKSALVENICVEVSKRGRAAIMATLEMETDQLGERMIASDGRVPITRIRTGNLRDPEYQAALEAAERLRKLPMSILHRPGATVGELRSAARAEFRKLKRTHGADPGVLVIDYLQLIDDQARKGENRDQAIGRIMKALVKLAAELRVPVILVSQLNRGVEGRQDKRPSLSDLRESGNIEQDAYAVLFVYRDDYYNRDSQDRGIAEIIVAKNRDGDTGWVKLKWTGEYTRFDALAVERDEWDEDFDEGKAA